MKLLRTGPVILGLLHAVLPCPAVHTDTVGLTAVDYQSYGPVWQRVFNVPGIGIHVAWLKTGMAANFYSYAAGSWRGEQNVFGSTRNAAGNLDVSLLPGPYHGSAFFSSYLNRDPKWPVVAVESVPGSGTYTVRPTDTSLMGCQRPPLALTADGTLHLLCLDSTLQDTLLYSRSTDYGTGWSAPVPVSGAVPPLGPTHSICASDSSRRVAALWTIAGTPSLWVNVSENGGSSWTGPVDLLPVPSSIPGARPGKCGAFGLFDREDRLNVVTQVWDETSQYPCEIWHWREGRTPNWTMVYRYAPDRVLAPAGDDGPLVLRPSICQRASDGRLFIAWLNYDSVNYEPETQKARADIFVAQSVDGGEYWSRPLRLTGPDNGSRLAPCLAPWCDDTLVLSCVTDQKAGIFELGHGGQSTNTANVILVAVDELPGIAEARSGVADERWISAYPTPARNVVTLRGPASVCQVRDCSGRLVAVIRSGEQWNCRRLAEGVYFVTAADCVPTRFTIAR